MHGGARRGLRPIVRPPVPGRGFRAGPGRGTGRTDGVDLETARFLMSARGQALLAAAREVRALDPLQRRGAMATQADPAALRAVLAQDDLRRSAAATWPEAERLLLTRAGLEQATAWPVARERAGRWPLEASTGLVDLGAGLGADALATAMGGRPVEAWEEDEVRAALLDHNARALGLEGLVRVRRGDVLAAAPTGRLAFFDPDRRPGDRRTRAPEDFRPKLSTWEALLAPFEAWMVKLPPVVAGEGLPPGPIEVVSLGGRLRERRLLGGAPFAEAAPRAALALPQGERVDGEGVGWPAAVDVEVGAWLLDPDASVTVADLVGDLARREGLAPAHPRIAYLVGPGPARAPGHWVRVEAVLPARAAAINRWLAEADVGQLTLRSRGLADPVASWRRRLKARGQGAATVVLTRDRRDRWVAYAGREHSAPMTRE